MQHIHFKEDLLNLSITELRASEEFKVVTQKYGYHTLGDILRLSKPYEVLKHKDFGYRMLFEFTSILRKNGLGGYLD